MRFTLRQIEVFLAVAKHKNTASAAESLHMSQSAVSSALQTLEKGYNLRLFDRVGKRLELNEEGKTLRQRAEALLQHANEFDLELKGHDKLGHLKIGASYTIANHLAVNYLSNYLALFPDANVDFFVANSPEVISKVLNYEVDVGMVETAVNHSDLDLIPLQQDELRVFCSPDHPLAKKRRISDSDLASARWILREAESGARQTFERTFINALPGLDIYLEFRHNEAIKRAVESGLGIGCLSEIVLQSNIREGSLIPLKLPKKYQMKRTFYFVLPKKGYRKKTIENWMQCCR